MNNVNITQHFFNAAAMYPERIALQSEKEEISYNNLLNKVNLYSIQFKKIGVNSGDKILVLHPLCTDLYAALLALLNLNCCLVFVEEWTKIRDIIDCQKKVSCKYVLCNSKVNLFRFFISELRTIKHLSLNLNKNANINFKNKYEINEQAIISFSSGTSGKSKAVIRTHQLLNAQFEALKDKIIVCDNAKMITNFPVVILLNLGLGITSYLSQFVKMSKLRKSNFLELYNEIQKNKISHISMSPYLVNQLSSIIQKHKISKLNLFQIISGGSPFFPAFVTNISNSINVSFFTVLYGSSEAEPIAFCNADDIILNQHKKGLFAGKIDSNCMCKIGEFTDGKFNESEQFCAGEIIVTGNHVVKKYYNSELLEQENKVELNGMIWHRTGDFAYFDENNNLYLTGNLTRKYEGDFVLEIEKHLQNIIGIERATIVNEIAYVQTSKSFVKRKIQEEIFIKYPNIKDIKFTDLPLDRRHHSKIKYINL